MFSKIIFLISESFRGLYRTKVPALISSITIAISLIILSTAIFSYYNFIGLTKTIKSEFAIETFFNIDIAYDDATNLYNRILLIDGIEQGEFIDKDKAAEIFEKYFNENVEEMLGENPLPMGANYIVSPNFRTPDQIKDIVIQIKRLNGVEDVLFQKDTVNKLNKIVEIILSISFIVGIFILCISIILVSNTITLIIYARKRTIEILQLLGATNSFIKFPFFIEGIIQGCLGSILSIFILFILNSLQIYLMDSISNSHLVVPSIIIPMNVILGVLLGIIGSYRGLFNQLEDYS
tara:strand:- start:3991 stop:4869 length:879 start_codon:yes stop_codon:yes gene_type:complete